MKDFIIKLKEEKMENIIARIRYYGKNEHPVNHFTCNLDRWLRGKELEFSPIRHAKFGRMTLSVIEFDKDNCIYILLPEGVFSNFPKEEIK